MPDFQSKGSSSSRVLGCVWFIVAVVMFCMEISGLISNFNYMQQTLAPLQGGVILFQDGTNSTGGGSSQGRHIVSTNICYPLKTNSFVQHLGQLYMIYMYFFIAAAIMFAASLYRSCLAGIKGF